MNEQKHTKHHLARNLEVGDKIQLEVLVSGRVTATEVTQHGQCLVTIAAAELQVPSFESGGRGAERRTAPKLRSAAWSADADTLVLACELAATQRIKYLGLPKVVLDTLKKLPPEALRALLIDAEQRKKPEPPAPPTR